MSARLIVLSGCALLAASLLLGRLHPFGDAGLYEARAAQTPMMRGDVPPGVRAILLAKCADCHSMQTRTPFYGRFAPASWMMERDIVDGRRKINLAQWDYYDANQQQTLKAKIVEETRTNEMPLLSYRLIHWSAGITNADLEQLSRWAREASVGKADASAFSIQEGDPARGKAVFEKRCTGCHAMDRDREGPRLTGVYGRTSGSIPGFAYSLPLKQAHIVWNDTSLEQWLADPEALVPENNMEFRVAKPQERQDLIRFLKEVANK
jgi:cytochrome c